MVTVCRHWLLTILFCSSLIWAVDGWADTIVLGNGDRISGELLEIIDGEVRWHSPLLGEIRLPQVSVKAIETRKPYHVQLGTEQRLSNCVLQGRSQDGRQVINCDDGPVEVSDWQLVARVSDLPLLERDRWQSSGFVTASAKKVSGTVEQEAYALDTRIELRRGKHRNTLTGEYDVERNGGERIVDQYKFSYQYDRFIFDQVFVHGSVGVERNAIREWSGRQTLGAGLGYQFFDTGLASLAMETGLTRVNTDRRDMEEAQHLPDARTLAWRLNTDFRWVISRFGLEFFHRSVYLQSLERGSDWEFGSDTGFKLPLIGRLGSEIKLEYDYDNAPAEGVDELEQVWSAGLRYDW